MSVYLALRGSSSFFGWFSLFLFDGDGGGSVGNQLVDLEERMGWRKPRKFGWEQQSDGCPPLLGKPVSTKTDEFLENLKRALSFYNDSMLL